MEKPVTAMRGTKLRCKGWRQEGILRMLENTVENGEKPEELIIYAASGKAARNWECFHKIRECLLNLEGDETLIVQSGKPVAIFKTRPASPRVLIANCQLVGKWANWETFWKLDDMGLIMFGQYTAGMWAYIGTQGILQGTFETLAECARQHFGGTLRGKLFLTGGLGAMGGAQPLATTMNDGVALIVEVDENRIDRRMKMGYCEHVVRTAREAYEMATDAVVKKVPRSIALVGNCADMLPELLEIGLKPDVLSDQTSAHDPLYGYIPSGYSVEEAASLRKENPGKYIEESYRSMARHVETILEFKKKGTICFEYGNNIREQAKKAGVTNAFDYQGFVPMFIRPMFCLGKGPCRWVALSGDPADIQAIDEMILKEFSHEEAMVRWIRAAQKYAPPQGLPARTSFLSFGDRAKFATTVNRMVRDGVLKAPLTMSRDHLDAGSVSQPTRETEAMLDGSDPIADWPVLNALLNASVGTDLVALHQGGGSGMGGSISAGMTVVIDGTAEAEEKLNLALTVDPGIGVVRHADAGYETARDTVRKHGIKAPMLSDR